VQTLKFTRSHFRLAKWWPWICSSINGIACPSCGITKEISTTFSLNSKAKGMPNSIMCLLITLDRYRVVAIDNSVTSLHMPVPVEKYIKLVHECLTSIATEPQKVFAGFARFAEMFLSFTGYQFPTASLLQVQFGVLEGVLSIINHVTLDMLTAFKKEMHDIVPKHTDWANVRKKSLIFYLRFVISILTIDFAGMV